MAVSSESNRKRASEWYYANLEYAKQKAREYAAANRDKARLRAKAWYAANKERAIATMRAARARNPERRKATLAAYRKANTERVSAWKRNYKLRKRGAEGSHTGADIQRLHDEQNGKCGVCKCHLVKYHVDHIMPLILGGSNYSDNLQLLCPPCNLSKHAKHPEEFMRRVSLLST